jgi:Trp operon repressor
MSSSSIITTRKTRSTNQNIDSIDESTIFDDLNSNLHSSNEFINIYNQYSQSITHRSTLINILCNILTLENLENKILLFIFDCLNLNSEYITEIQFKQYLLPFIKNILIKNNDLILSIIRFLLILVEYRSNILNSTLAEWLSCLLNFLVTNLSSTTYIIYGDLINDLLYKIVKQFLPLSKEIVDILSRLSITSTNFLNQLKSWIKNSDDIRLALFSLHLWQSLSAIFSRLLIRGHTKGNEILSVIEDAFLVSNYSIRSEAFTTWSSFMLHIHQYNDIDNHQRLLKLFLTPFLSDYTSKSKSASISKCHSWITLISIYPKNLNDVILPFLSFSFGNNHLSSNTNSTTTAWWLECRKIGGEFIQNFLINNIHSEYIIKLASDQILNYLFDSIVDQLLEYKINNNQENFLWLNSWNAYLNHLMNILKSNNSINENQHVAINTCLLTRIEQLWIDSRIETKFLLKLFETFEQISFPLAIETVLRDSSIRTKTLSAAQIHPSSGYHKSRKFNSFSKI